jgi:hypothetical protein
VGRSVLLGARAGIVAGVVYFVVIAALVAFDAVLGAGGTTLLGLVLLVGIGVACGLGLGLVAGLADGLVLRAAHRRGVSATRLRVLGGLAAGGCVLACTLVEQTTGVVGVLDPDITTVVVIPTLVAAAVGSASAPGLAAAGDRKG